MILVKWYSRLRLAPRNSQSIIYIASFLRGGFQRRCTICVFSMPATRKAAGRDSAASQPEGRLCLPEVPKAACEPPCSAGGLPGQWGRHGCTGGQTC